MALREINLVPAEVLYRQHLQRHACFWGGCLVLALALVCVGHLYLARTVLAKKQSLDNLKAQHSQLGAKVEEIKHVQGELARLTEQQAVLDKITRNSPYSHILVALAETINEGTWLTKLAIEGTREDTGRGTVKLTGFAHSNEDLGGLLNRLSKRPLFTAVVLEYARETRDAHSNKDAASPSPLMHFQIDCHL